VHHARRRSDRTPARRAAARAVRRHRGPAEPGPARARPRPARRPHPAAADRPAGRRARPPRGRRNARADRRPARGVVHRRRRRRLQHHAADPARGPGGLRGPRDTGTADQGPVPVRVRGADAARPLRPGPSRRPPRPAGGGRMSIVTLIGNPKAGSRTHTVAVKAAEAVGRAAGREEAAEVVDLSALGSALLAPGASAAVELALETVTAADVLVVASPTYKGTYTGLLKSFLDRLPGGALQKTVALPLLVMGSPRHALAVELHLRPLLVELGAVVPTPGLAVLESELPRLDEVLDEWAARIAPQVAVALRAPLVNIALQEGSRA